jgi:hypothetical protein
VLPAIFRRAFDIGRSPRLEHLPDRPIGQFRMAMRLGVGHALVGKPGVQLIVVFEPQPRREEALADQPVWFSTCPFSQPDAGMQATGSTRKWLHICRKRRLIEAVLADKDRLIGVG